MRHEQFAVKVAYACIFAKTVEEASENLVGLITEGRCGFDEGAAAWRAVVNDYLQLSDDLSELNRYGAIFTRSEWLRILEQLRSRLP